MDLSAWLTVVGSAILGGAWAVDLLLDEPAIEVPSFGPQTELQAASPAKPGPRSNVPQGSVSLATRRTSGGALESDPALGTNFSPEHTTGRDGPDGGSRPGARPVAPVLFAQDGEIRGHHFIIRGLRNGKVEFR